MMIHIHLSSHSSEYTIFSLTPIIMILMKPTKDIMHNNKQCRRTGFAWAHVLFTAVEYSIILSL